MSKGRIRDLTISQVMNGFIVKVGCQTLVFTGIEALVNELMAYADDPTKVEAEWIEKFGFGGVAAIERDMSGGSGTTGTYGIPYQVINTGSGGSLGSWTVSNQPLCEPAPTQYNPGPFIR